MKTVDNDPGSCAKQKLDKIVEKLTTKVQAVHYNEVKSTSLSDHNNLVHMIKTKTNAAETSEKIRLLTRE